MHSFLIPPNRLNQWLHAMVLNWNCNFAPDYIFQTPSGYEIVILKPVDDYTYKLMRDFQQSICSDERMYVKELNK